MKLNPPKKITFWVSVILAAAGVVLILLDVFGIFVHGRIGIALLTLGYALLAAGLLIKGL